MYLHCPKCLTGRSGDELGAPCRTNGCDGVIARVPDYHDLVDVLPEPMTCGRRFDTYMGHIPVHRDRSEAQDRWHRHKSNGDRVCSFCGSLHPDDFFRLVKAAADAGPDAGDDAPSIDPSDKGYKVYVRQKGVRNAREGGIKFYTQHLPRPVPEERHVEYSKALQASRVRFERQIAAMHAGVLNRLADL